MFSVFLNCLLHGLSSHPAQVRTVASVIPPFITLLDAFHVVPGHPEKRRRNFLLLHTTKRPHGYYRSRLELAAQEKETKKERKAFIIHWDGIESALSMASAGGLLILLSFFSFSSVCYSRRTRTTREVPALCLPRLGRVASLNMYGQNEPT
jgi:hypothetical protein